MSLESPVDWLINTKDKRIRDCNGETTVRTNPELNEYVGHHPAEREGKVKDSPILDPAGRLLSGLTDQLFNLLNQKDLKNKLAGHALIETCSHQSTRALACQAFPLKLTCTFQTFPGGFLLLP